MIIIINNINRNVWRANGKTTKCKKEKWQENNSIDTLSDKLERLCTRWSGHGYGGDTWREKLTFYWWQQKILPEESIDNTQQNSKFRLCGNSNERVNYIINECRKLAQKEYKTWLGGKGDPLGIVQDINILPCWEMVYTQTRICPRKCDTHTQHIHRYIHMCVCACVCMYVCCFLYMRGLLHFHG